MQFGCTSKCRYTGKEESGSMSYLNVWHCYEQWELAHLIVLYLQLNKGQLFSIPRSIQREVPWNSILRYHYSGAYEMLISGASCSFRIQDGKIYKAARGARSLQNLFSGNETTVWLLRRIIITSIPVALRYSNSSCKIYYGYLKLELKHL